ncbi:hypothetical protein EMPS_08270 [Entomortierella parvispora]|uniref:Uncharacterized protein n=1 Tax=Entomortierella parvispora TaxID=205924 RepID=A0A9P3HFX0_9FUNG|nr:hypothetical protein EMPS_08270 [Entomortierella parvispora]
MTSEKSRVATHNTTSLLPPPSHPPLAPSSQLPPARQPQFKEVVLTCSSHSKTSSTFGLSSSSSAIVHPVTTASTSTSGSTCALSSFSSSSPPFLSKSKALARTISTSSDLHLQSGHLAQDPTKFSNTDPSFITVTPTITTTVQSTLQFPSHRQLQHTAHRPGQLQPVEHSKETTQQQQQQQPPQRQNTGRYPMNRSEQGSQVQETIAAFSRLMMEGKSATTTITHNSSHNSSSSHFYKSAPVLPLLTISTPPVSSSAAAATSTLESSQLSASPSPPALSPLSGTASSLSNSSSASSSPATPSYSTMPTTLTTMNGDKAMFSLSQPVMPMSLIPAAIMGLQSTPPCVTAGGMMMGDNDNKNNNAQGNIKINTDLSNIRRGSKGSTASSGSRSPASLLPLVGRDYLSFCNTDTNTMSSTTSSPLSAKPRPLSSMEFAESWLPTVAKLSPEESIANAESSRMVPLFKESTVTIRGDGGTKERDSSMSTSQQLSSTMDENRTHGHIIGGMQEADEPISSFSTLTMAKSSTGVTTTPSSFSATTSAAAVARASMDQQSIHPLQMDPDPDSINPSATLTGPIDPAIASPLDFGSSFVLESLQPHLGQPHQGQHQQEQQQGQRPVQVIRKKTSFAAKLRKVFVAKQSIQSDNNSSVTTPTYSPRESSLGMLAVAQQTHENVAMLASPGDDAPSDVSSDRLQQHRGSESSVSTVESPVTRPNLLRRGSAPTLSTSNNLNNNSNGQYLTPPVLLTNGVLYSDPDSEASSPSPTTPQSSTEESPEHTRLPSNQTTAIKGLKPTPTRTVKKRLSFASISSFFNGRQANAPSTQQQQQKEQTENHSKQQRSSSVPHVENPLAVVGRQIAGFQRRHSLNDLDDSNQAASKRNQNNNALQRFMSTTPRDKERVPAGTASDGSTPVSAPVITPKRLTLNKVFSKQLRRKSSTPVKTDIPPFPPKPLRSALAHRSAITVTVNSNLGAAGAKVHHVHRSSRRRAASIRSQNSTQRHSHPPTGVSAGGRNRLSQTDPLARLSEANKQLATLSRSNTEDQQQQQAHLKRLAAKRSKSHRRREQERVRGGKRPLSHHPREPSQHGEQDSSSSLASEDSESCSSPVSHEGPSGFPGEAAENQQAAPSPTRMVPPGQGDRLGGAFDSRTFSSPTTPRVLPVITKFGSPPRNPLSTLSPSPSYESYSSSSSLSDGAAASFRSTSSLSESGSYSSSSFSSPNGSPTAEKVPEIMVANNEVEGCSNASNALLPASAARLSVHAITVEREAAAAGSDAILTPKHQQANPSLVTVTSTLESSSTMSNSSTEASSTSSPASKSEMVQVREGSLRGAYSAQQQPSQPIYHQYLPDQQQQAVQVYPSAKDVQNYHHHQYLQTLQQQQFYHHQLQQQQLGSLHYPHHQQYYYADPSLYPPRPPRQLQFSTEEPMIHPTWTPEQYDRTSDPNITASRLTPTVAHKIKLELNQFKSQEMEVHEDSRVYTHFFI